MARTSCRPTQTVRSKLTKAFHRFPSLSITFPSAMENKNRPIHGRVKYQRVSQSAGEHSQFVTTSARNK